MNPPQQPDDPSTDYERQQGRCIYYRPNDDKAVNGFRAILDGLIVLGIASLIGVVWSMSNNLSGMAVQLKYMADQISDLRGRMK